MMGLQRLGINNPIFKDVREKLDACLNMAIEQMETKSLDEAAVTLKIGMEIKTTVDRDGVVRRVPDFQPVVKLKIGSNASVRCAVPDTVMEIDGCGNVLVGSNQITMEEMTAGA